MRWILVDRMVELDPGVSALGIRSFSLSESFFADHFPGLPIVPGVLQVEMIAQVGGRCVRAARPEVLTVLSSVKNAKFRKSIRPGDQAFIRVKVLANRENYALVEGQVEVNDQKVSEAQVMYGYVPIPESMKERNDLR